MFLQIHRCLGAAALQPGGDQSLGTAMVAAASMLDSSRKWLSAGMLPLSSSVSEAQLHYWLAGSFIQRLPVNKRGCQAPSHPPPLISGDLHLTSLCTRTITLSFLQRVIAAFVQVISGPVTTSSKALICRWCKHRL